MGISKEQRVLGILPTGSTDKLNKIKPSFFKPMHPLRKAKSVMFEDQFSEGMSQLLRIFNTFTVKGKLEKSPWRAPGISRFFQFFELRKK